MTLVAAVFDELEHRLQRIRFACLETAGIMNHKSPVASVICDFVPDVVVAAAIPQRFIRMPDARLQID
jgi:hypothetical protein